MKAIPAVQKYMTYVPKSIGFDQTIAQAQEMMKTLRARHLPVLDGGKLVGLLSDRDVNLVLQFNDVDPKTLKVEEAYTPDPYFTAPTTPLSEVVAHMAEKKYGCAIIVDNGKVVGIFTETDAYKALAELLETRLKH
ncbi:MAG: CBS domain-containing protein [Bdellovibrionaceae bacterium]|nr:CBS domain-containing protein [Pseudobdellovibrionaceae bacterium]